MGRYEIMFERLSANRQGAFVPFTVIGDPTLEESLGIIESLVEGGADALELGIPFSDPIADGPTIQAATARALSNGATPSACFDIIAQVRAEFPEIPIGLLVYANLVVSKGEARFYKSAAAAGVDSVLVADVPIFESAPFIQHATEHGIDPVFIAPPNADDGMLEKISRATKGYTYVVARPGVTGADQHRQHHRRDILTKLSSMKAPPSLLGFGISRPDHVQSALAAGARGAISGSAVVNIVAKHRGRARLSRLGDFVRDMKAATHRTEAPS